MKGKHNYIYAIRNSMVIVTFFLVLIYFYIIIYVNLKYNLNEKCNKKYEIYRETDIELSPIEAAYLVDVNANSIDLLLAGILELSRKGYIELKIEEKKGKKEYVFYKTEKEINLSEIKKYEIGIYRFFFNEDGYKVIYLREYLSKLNWTKKAISDLEVKMINIKQLIDEEFINKGIFDGHAIKKLKKFNDIGKKALNTFLASIVTMFMLAILGYCSFSKQVFFVSLVGILMSICLIANTNKDERKRTIYGDDLREKVKGIKAFLKEYTLIKQRPIYTVNILEEKYIWGVALGITDIGEKEFIKPVYNKRRIKFSIYFVLEVLMITALIIIIFMNKELMKYLFLIVIMICVIFFPSSHSDGD